jgi:hypothetical protein
MVMEPPFKRYGRKHIKNPKSTLRGLPGNPVAPAGYFKNLQLNMTALTTQKTLPVLCQIDSGAFVSILPQL